MCVMSEGNWLVERRDGSGGSGCVHGWSLERGVWCSKWVLGGRKGRFGGSGDGWPHAGLVFVTVG